MFSGFPTWLLVLAGIGAAWWLAVLVASGVTKRSPEDIEGELFEGAYQLIVRLVRMVLLGFALYTVVRIVIKLVMWAWKD